MTARKLISPVLGVLISAVVLTPQPAFAIPPLVQTVTVTNNFGQIGVCGEDQITATFVATRRITTFYDDDGTAIRRQVHAEVPGVITNTATGNSLVTKGVRNITVNLVTGEVKSTASNVHVVVPGQGTVVLAAGLFELDQLGNLVKEVGRQDAPVTPALCDALADS